MTRPIEPARRRLTLLMLNVAIFIAFQLARPALGFSMPKKLAPVHPGEILTEDFLKPMGLSAYAVATAVGVPRTRIERVARGETPVTADTALRLGKFFGMSAQFWLNAQVRYDLETAEDRSGKRLRKSSNLRVGPNPLLAVSLRSAVTRLIWMMRLN